MKKDYNAFDADGGRPLQLRRGSDAEGRRSLLEKYDGALNSGDSGEVSYHEADRENMAESSMIRLSQDLEASRKKKIKIAAIVGGIVLAITVLVLVIVLNKKGGSNPPDPDNPIDPNNPIFSTNPYTLTEVLQTGAYSYKTYTLTRDTTLDKNLSASMSPYAIETSHNKFIDTATLRTQVYGSFNTMRIQVSSPSTPAYDMFLTREFVADGNNLRLA